MSITCLDCPSFMTKEESSEFFKISAAGPMCARYGWIFGYNNNAVEAALEKYSMTCPSRGNQRPDEEIISSNFGSIFEPRPELLNATGEEVADCRNCRNFDTSQHACAAQGRMIYPERYESEAKGCIFANPDDGGLFSHNEVGPILGHLTGSTVSVSVTRKPTSKPTPPKAPVRIKYPNQYDSDAPVKEEQKHMIRAYRRVETRKLPIFLPIFRTDFFGDRAADIPDPEASGQADPSLYIDHANLLHEFAVKTYKLDQNLCLVGEPGSGKTDGVVWLAWMLNMPFERLPYTEDSDPDQFLGTPQYGDTGKADPDGKPILGTYFEPGLLPKAWVQPGFLLSDEVNMPQEAIQQAYRSMNDSSRLLVVYGNKFKRHDYCFHLAAMNPAHDFRNIGAKSMASADSSRMVFHKMPNPSDDMLRKILTTTVKRLDEEDPDPFLITTIIKIGTDLRNLSREGTLPDFWTIRQEIKVARMAPFFGLMGAYNAAYLDYVDQNTREVCETAIRSHTPSGPDWAH